MLILAALVAATSGPALADGRQRRPPRMPFELEDPDAQKPKHITVVPSTDPATIAPGEGASLRLAVEPGPRIHVYAPGETKYQVIALTLEDTPGVTVKAPKFPPAESLFFAPLSETVLVYSKRFEIVQDVTLDDSPAGQKALAGRKQVIVRGTLAYQACDDTTCFLPARATVEWRVGIRAPASRRPSPR